MFSKKIYMKVLVFFILFHVHEITPMDSLSHDERQETLRTNMSNKQVSDEIAGFGFNPAKFKLAEHKGIVYKSHDGQWERLSDTIHEDFKGICNWPDGTHYSRTMEIETRSGKITSSQVISSTSMFPPSWPTTMAAVCSLPGLTNLAELFAAHAISPMIEKGTQTLVSRDAVSKSLQEKK